MRGFLLIYGNGNMIVISDSTIDSIIDNFHYTNNVAKGLIEHIINFKKSVFINDENYPKVDLLFKSEQYDLLRELYHTLKAEESIIDRENRIMELNNKITGIDESIKE